MGQPLSNVRPDPILTNIAMEYSSGPEFVVNQLVPLRPVAARAYKYATWDTARILLNQEAETLRAPGVRANLARDPQLTWATGAVKEYALAAAVTDEERGEAVAGLDLDRVRTENITRKLLMARETYFRDLIQDTGTIASAVPGVKWDAAAAVVIEANVDAAKEAFLLQCGVEPTHIVIPPAVAKVMKRDSTLRALIKWTNDSLLVNGDLPPTIWNMRTVIPGAINNTAAPGAAASVARIWTADKVTLLYVDPAAASDPRAMTAVFGAYCTYDGQALAVERQRDPYESAKSDLITAYLAWDMKAVVACAYIIDDVLT